MGRHCVASPWHDRAVSEYRTWAFEATGDGLNSWPRGPTVNRPREAFLWRASTICYHVHGGSYCDMGGVHELPSRQAGSVGRSGDHRADCAPRIVRLAGRRDATSTVNHHSVLPGRLHPRKWIGGCCLIARQTPQCERRSYGLEDAVFREDITSGRWIIQLPTWRLAPLRRGFLLQIWVNRMASNTPNNGAGPV